MQPNNSATLPWSFARKTQFRFFFLFFALFFFFNPNGVLPYSENVYDFYITPFHKFIPWVGKHVLHLSYDIVNFTAGSGDTTYDWLILLLLTLLTVLGCIIWTVVDRKRNSYNVLNYWFTVVLRYFLSFILLNYGFGKVFRLQMPFPGIYALSEPYGNSSPMRLAWTFFGYSRGYNYFTGFAEVISGLLLLFRRTTRIGLILALVVSLNIVAVNYFFDVCVKLFSSMMIVMLLYLLWQDKERQLNFFFLNKATEPVNSFIPRFRRKWINTSIVVFKYLLIGFVVFKDCYDCVDRLKEYDTKIYKSPLYGLYDVQTFVRNRDTIAPLTTDTTRWRKLMITGFERSAVKLMNDSAKTYAFRIDTVTKKIVMFRGVDSARKSTLEYSVTGKDGLLLRGKWMNDSVTIILKKYDLNKLLLVNRGFHLINEVPLNR